MFNLKCLLMILIINQSVVSMFKDGNNTDVINEKTSEINDKEDQNGKKNEIKDKLYLNEVKNEIKMKKISKNNDYEHENVKNYYSGVKNEIVINKFSENNDNEHQNGKKTEMKDIFFHIDDKNEIEMKKISENKDITPQNCIKYELTGEMNNNNHHNGVTSEINNKNKNNRHVLEYNTISNNSQRRFVRAVDNETRKNNLVKDIELYKMHEKIPHYFFLITYCDVFNRSPEHRENVVLICLNGVVVDSVDRVKYYEYNDGELATVLCINRMDNDHRTVMKYYEKQGENIEKVFEVVGELKYHYISAAYIKLQSDRAFKIECEIQNINDTRLTTFFFKMKKEQSTPSFLVNGLRLSTWSGWNYYTGVQFSKYFTFPDEPIVIAITKTADYDGAECNLIKYPIKERSHVIYRNDRIYFKSHNFTVLCLLKNQGKIVPNKNLTLYSVNDENGYLPMIAKMKPCWSSDDCAIEGYRNSDLVIYGLRWSKILLKYSDLKKRCHYVRYLYEENEVLILAFVSKTSNVPMKLLYNKDATKGKLLLTQSHQGLTSEIYSFVLKTGYNRSIILSSKGLFCYTVELVKETKRPDEVELLKLTKGKFPDEAITDSHDPENNIMNKLCLDCVTNLKVVATKINENNEKDPTNKVNLMTFLLHRVQENVIHKYIPGDSYILTCESVTDDVLEWTDLKNGISSKNCGTIDTFDLILKNLNESDNGSIFECKTSKNQVSVQLVMENEYFLVSDIVQIHKIDGIKNVGCQGNIVEAKVFDYIRNVFCQEMVTDCGKKTVEKIIRKFNINHDDTNSDLPKDDDTDSGNYLVIIMSVLIVLGFIIIILTFIILVLRKRSLNRNTTEPSPGDNRVSHVYEAVLYDTPGNQPMDISERAPLPLPLETPEENGPYIHYDTPYEFRIFRLGVNHRI